MFARGVLDSESPVQFNHSMQQRPASQQSLESWLSFGAIRYVSCTHILTACTKKSVGIWPEFIFFYLTVRRVKVSHLISDFWNFNKLGVWQDLRPNLPRKTVNTCQEKKKPMEISTAIRGCKNAKVLDLLRKYCPCYPFYRNGRLLEKWA